VPPPPAHLKIDPCNLDRVFALERDLGVSHAFAQVLVRRGLDDADAARAWLAADERHEPSAFAGIDTATELVLDHVRSGRRITIHGDYDVDGVTSTAILVGVLRTLGADVDWFLPSRAEDGYGLSAATVTRLAARGTRLLITADCAITAVDEVAAARAAGIDVLVTDHHSPRADGRLPDAPIVHPAVCGYPCADLCAAAVAYKLSAALLAAAGRDPALADLDLDLVALATIADCVPLRGENRRLVRAGLRALAATKRPGLRALMRVARADPARIDARAVGFRLAPRINAAGRLERADAGLELLLTADEIRAAQIADELDRLNAERRHTETRILFEAETMVAELSRERERSAAGEPAAYVLAAEGWHKGVIGIVASRIAERHHRPTVLVALDPQSGRGTGSGRSIPGFDLHDGLRQCAGHLERWGGHAAAAGLSIKPERVEAFAEAFSSIGDLALGEDDLRPPAKVDALVHGRDLTLDLCAELASLAPFGLGNPGITLLLAGCELAELSPVGDGKHLRFRVREDGRDSGSAIAFRFGGQIDRLRRVGHYDVAFRLEANQWNGTVSPQLNVREIFDAAERYVERRDWLKAQWRTPVDEREGDAVAIFAELGLAEAGARRHLLESELFVALLAEPELARAA
jgi:single-stranded-DNA-specific exonuclease